MGVDRPPSIRMESRLRWFEHEVARVKWIGCGLIFLSSGPCQAAGGGPG